MRDEMTATVCEDLRMNRPLDDSSGWAARLDLSFTQRDAVTVLDDNRHTGPLRVQRPLYPEAGVCHVCILHPPGGVVGGDRLELMARVNSEATALLTTPGAAKFYRSGGPKAAQTNCFHLKDRGRMEWLPQESIVFPEARAAITTQVEMEGDAGFIGWEIVCLGLPRCGHPFSGGDLRSTWAIRRDGRPLFTDRLLVSDAADLNRPAGLRNHSVSAIFAATGCKPEFLPPLRRMISESAPALCGLTLLDDLLVARWIGESSALVKTVFQHLWAWLRPRLFGREACPPRIWNT